MQIRYYTFIQCCRVQQRLEKFESRHEPVCSVGAADSGENGVARMV